MFWAVINNERVEPKPKTIGICPLCGGKVYSKCGEVYAWHWAHRKSENCDPWYEPESYWHLNWKMTFGKENSEKVMMQNNQWHRADILTKENVVIELQNSPIQKSVINEREEFYGEKMMWLINGIDFKNNFIIYDDAENYNRWSSQHNQAKSLDGKKTFRWSYTRKSWDNVKRPVFIDFGEETIFWVTEGMGTSMGYGKFVPKEKFINKYGGNYEYYYQEYQNRIQEAAKLKKMQEAIRSREGWLHFMRNRKSKRW